MTEEVSASLMGLKRIFAFKSRKIQLILSRADKNLNQSSVTRFVEISTFVPNV
jgi:hypothetical protein